MVEPVERLKQNILNVTVLLDSLDITVKMVKYVAILSGTERKAVLL